MPVIGFLVRVRASDSAHLVCVISAGLAEAATSRAQNMAIEYRWAEGQNDRLPDWPPNWFAGR